MARYLELQQRAHSPQVLQLAAGSFNPQQVEVLKSLPIVLISAVYLHFSPFSRRHNIIVISSRWNVQYGSKTERINVNSQEAHGGNYGYCSSAPSKVAARCGYEALLVTDLTLTV
jgi:hypothetical protein